MKKEYNPDSERKYAAPEAPSIVEPEPMIPKWIKKPISYLVVLYLGLISGGFFVGSGLRIVGMPKSKIEEKIENNNSKGGLVKFANDSSKPGRELSYSIFGDGEQ
jgi:hypothetical protein